MSHHDLCLHTVSGISVIRTNIKSAASGVPRHRYDEIFRCAIGDGDAYDIAAIEFSRGGTATKQNVDADGRKLVTGLKGMLNILMIGSRGGQEIQVVGVMCIGWKVEAWTVHLVGRALAAVLKGRGRTVRIECEEWGAVIEVMGAAVRVESVVERAVEKVGVWDEGRRGLWG